MSDTRLKDKKWRIAYLYKIRDKYKQLVKFKRNRAQEHYNANKHTRNIILKSRQLGFTTDESIDSLDDVLFTPNMECLMIAHNLDAGEKIFDGKVELAWKNLDERLRKLWKVDTNSSKTLKFEFGDGSYSSIAVDTSGRSGTYNRVHVTEFAEIAKKYPQRAQEIIAGTIPAVPVDGRIDIESTSQGSAGEFYDIFDEAWQRRGKPILPVQFKAHFYNWQWDDDQLAKITEAEINSFFESEDFDEFDKYQDENHLTDREITYYYHRWLSLGRDWNELRREYPTTPEEAFDAVIEGAFFGTQIAKMENDKRITLVPHDPALKVHTVWDLGIGKNLKIGFYQKDKLGFLRRIDSWEGTEGGTEGIPEGIKAVKDKPYVYGKHFAPHDIRSTDVGTGKTRWEAAKALDFIFEIVAELSLEDGISAATLALATLIVDAEKNKSWLKGMKNYIREWDDKRGMYKDVPLHNWASHYADEWRYAAISSDKMTNEHVAGYTVRKPNFTGYNRRG